MLERCGTSTGTITRESVGEKERNAFRVLALCVCTGREQSVVCIDWRSARTATVNYAEWWKKKKALPMCRRAQRGSTSCGGKLIRAGDGGSQQIDEGSHGARRRRRSATLHCSHMVVVGPLSGLEVASRSLWETMVVLTDGVATTAGRRRRENTFLPRAIDCIIVQLADSIFWRV